MRHRWIESPRTGAALWIYGEPSATEPPPGAAAASPPPTAAPARARSGRATKPPAATAQPSPTAKNAGVGTPRYHPEGAYAVKRRLHPGMGRFPAHVHLDFAERFEVTRGAGLAEIDGDVVRLSEDPSSCTLYIPPGVPHVNPYNEGGGDLEFWQSFVLGTEGARSYVQTLAEVLSDGRDHDGELPWPLILAVADVTRERTYLTPVSRAVRRGNAGSFTLQRRFLLPVGSAMARMRGYTVYLDDR